MVSIVRAEDEHTSCEFAKQRMTLNGTGSDSSEEKRLSFSIPYMDIRVIYWPFLERETLNLKAGTGERAALRGLATVIGR